jgi:hypothetical protein
MGTLTKKDRKGRTQPIEKRTEKIWIVSGQPVQAQAKKDTEKTKKHIGKWCDFHKSPWHKTIDCRSK